MKPTGDAVVAGREPACTEQLVRFFPQAVALRVAVQVTALRPGKTRLSERTLIEYGSSDNAIFLSNLPLEFDDRVLIERNPGPGRNKAAVIAVQYHEGKKAVAVRFLDGSREWIMQP